MSRIFKHQVVVPEEAVDTNGHVNNVVYIQWMQDAAIRHSESQGCDSRLYRDLGVTWVVRSHYIEYLSPAFAGDRIDVFTWVSNMKRLSSLRKYSVVRVGDETRLAKAETSWIYINLSSGRPCAIHEEVRNAFEIVPQEEEP